MKVRLSHKNRSSYDTMLPVVGLNTVLDEHVGVMPIDYVKMDIDGAEIPILNALKDGGRLALAGVVFCQVLYCFSE